MSRVVSVKNLPDSVRVALRDGARRNRRSVASEALVCLANAPLEAPTVDEIISDLRDFHALLEREGLTFTEDEVEAWIEDGHR